MSEGEGAGAEEGDFKKIVEENALEQPGLVEVAEQLILSEAANERLFAILALVAAQQGGMLTFNREDWEAETGQTSAIFSEDMLTGQIRIEFQ